MSKTELGKIDDKKAEKCMVALDGKPCPLFFKGSKYSTCAVRVTIDQGRNTSDARRDAINMHSTQIPDNNCPGKYK